MIKLISWNVNGLRACMQKAVYGILLKTDADIFCIQETKLTKRVNLNCHWKDIISIEHAIKKDIQGLQFLQKKNLLMCFMELVWKNMIRREELLHLNFLPTFLVNVYTPNSKRELERLDYRMVWEDIFKNYLKKLEEKKGGCSMW